MAAKKRRKKNVRRKTNPAAAALQKKLARIAQIARAPPKATLEQWRKATGPKKKALTKKLDQREAELWKKPSTQ